MPVTVRLPSALRQVVKNRSTIEAQGSTITELVENMDGDFPGMMDRIFDKNGKKRKFVNLYLNKQDVRFLEQEMTPVKDGDELDVVVAIAGG